MKEKTLKIIVVLLKWLDSLMNGLIFGIGAIGAFFIIASIIVNRT